MILANKSRLDINGKNIELFYELDSIIKYAIEEQPEMIQAILSNRGDDMVNAKVNGDIVVGLDILSKKIIELEKKGGDTND